MYRGDRVERLTATEARLLRHLAASPDSVVERGALYEDVWGYARDSRSRTLDVTVGNLRKKIEEDPRLPDHVLTEVGIGYRLVYEAPDERPAPPVAPRSPLFGRDKVAAEIRATLEAHGQLSLVGMPGVGKSALARMIGSQPGGRWPAGSLEVAADARPEVFLTRLGEVLGIEPPASGPTSGFQRQLAAALEQRGGLLVLVDGASPSLAETFEQLCDSVPSLVLLVTAPGAVGLRNEQVLELAPLDADAGVALFLERVKGRRPEHAADLGAVAEIVGLLEGLPLALEIAAARCAMVGEQRTLEHLADTKPSESLAALERALAWAWDQLSLVERRALAQASVFRGGFSVDAAEEVLQLPAGAPGIVAVLESLRDHGLVELVRADDGLRPYLREPVRSFAGAQLDDDDARRRHIRWYSTAARRSGLQANEADWEAAFAWQLREQGNLDQALRVAVVLDPEAAARIAIGMKVLGLHRLGTERYREVLDLGIAAARHLGSTRLLAELLVLRVSLEVDRVGADGAERHMPETEELVEAVHDARLRGLLLHARAKVARSRGASNQANQLARRAVELLASSDDRYAEASARAWLGFRLCEVGDLTTAYEHLERSLAQASAIGSVSLEIKVRVSWTVYLHRRGRLVEANQHQLRSLELARAHGLRRWEGASLNNIGVLLLQLGDAAAAREHLESALAVNLALGAVAGTAMGRSALGTLLAEQGDHETADGLHAQALEACRRGGDQRLLAQCLHTLGRTRLLQGMPDGAAVCLREAVELFTLLDQAWDLDRARLDLALALQELGHVEHARFALNRVAEARHVEPVPVARSLATAQLGALHALEGSSWAAMACIDEARSELTGFEDPAVTAALEVWQGFRELAQLRALGAEHRNEAAELRTRIQERLAVRAAGAPGELREPPLPRTYPIVVARLLRRALQQDELVA